MPLAIFGFAYGSLRSVVVPILFLGLLMIERGASVSEPGKTGGALTRIAEGIIEPENRSSNHELHE